ncbi:hypothetical protein Tco_0722558 [Tanacetum coccineum]
MYASRKLKIHEKNYTTHGLGLGAVVFTLKIWKHLLVTRSWWKIYFAVLVDIAEGIGNTAKHAYDLSSSNGKTKSPVLWAEIGEIRSIGPELVQETTNKVILIKEKLKAARDCQKSYVGNRRKHLELKLEYWTDANMHVPLEEIKVHKTLRFVEEPVEIIDREVKSLKRSRISIVKVCWNSKRGYEDFMKTKVMNYLLQAIPNDIYNLVDACKNAKEMWQRIKRLMFGSEITSHVRHSRIMDEFDKFATKEGESLESVYERLTTLVNIMDRNNVRPISMSINTKFLNCLQPEWSKYVTIVHHNQNGDNVSYDVLYDSLVQFEPHVLASKTKKAAKNHDPLALISHSNASSSQSHANSSYSPQPYYVTHPSSVVDYDDEYQGGLQGDSQGNKLTTAMMLLARAMVEMLTRMQEGKTGIKGLMQEMEVMKAIRLFSVFRELIPLQAKQIEQMLLVMKDEAGSNLTNKENDFMIDSSYGEDTLEELTVAVMLMARL